jgi:hypothetical protein
MKIPPKPENDSIRNAFITTSIALYLQSCHLQYEEEADAVMLSFLIANANASNSGSTPGDQLGNNNTGQGNAGNSGDDDGSDDTNLGSSLVNNTGETAANSENIDADDKSVPKKITNTAGQSEVKDEPAATTSPGGNSDSRIIGGVNSEEDNIDWTGAVEEGTKDADAATG